MENERIRGSRRSGGKRSKTGLNWLTVTIMVMALALVCAGIYGIIAYLPEHREMDYFEHYSSFDKDETNIVLADKMLKRENYPVIKNGEVYIPVDFIKEYVDEYIFWDKKTGRLTITNEYNVIRMNTEDLTYYVNSKPMALNLAVYDIGGSAYMPESFLTGHYDIEINYSQDKNIVYIDYTKDGKQYAITSNKKTNMRFLPDKKSYIIETLGIGTKLLVFEEEGDYTRVRTESGLIGYVLTKHLGEYENIKGFTKESVQPEFKKPKTINGKVNMIWDMMERATDNNDESKRTVHFGLDVLSPQWFRFDRESYSGEILSIADMSYVSWAHDNGYQVWAMLFDEEDGEVTAQILTDQEKREYVIRQILAFVAMFNIDGINIDFERVREVDVQYFHQFLRELWPLLREQGVILSVDTFVPSAWSMYYNREEIAKTVDYICVMTYDENTYGGSSGPNASIGFVENGITNTLKEVPPEKLIMGIPYYSRVWVETETGTGTEYKIRSLGMNYAYRLFTENGAVFEWREELGSYYGEYDIVEDGVKKKYRTWLEDERSIEEKLKLVEKYGLAGVCAWVRGLEKQEIWDVLYEHLKK